jgi:hypothetical protein
VDRALFSQAEPPREAVGVEVAGEKGRLKEEEAGRPDRGRPAEPGKDVLSDDRLDGEEQERGEKYRERFRDHEGRDYASAARDAARADIVATAMAFLPR